MVPALLEPPLPGSTSLDETPLGSMPFEPASLEPTSLEPTSLEPASLEPTQLEPVSLEPTQLEPTQLEPTQLEPTSLEPTRLGPTSLEPAYPEPSPLRPFSPSAGSDGSGTGTLDASPLWLPVEDLPAGTDGWLPSLPSEDGQTNVMPALSRENVPGYDSHARSADLYQDAEGNGGHSDERGGHDVTDPVVQERSDGSPGDDPAESAPARPARVDPASSDPASSDPDAADPAPSDRGRSPIAGGPPPPPPPPPPPADQGDLEGWPGFDEQVRV